MTTFLEQITELKGELLKKNQDIEILWPKEITDNLHIKDPETNNKYSSGENSTSKIKGDIADNSEIN